MRNMIIIILQYIASFIFPERTKRLIVMSSLLSKLIKKHNLDIATLKRVNETLQICGFESAMILPMRYSHTLWNGVEIHNHNAESIDIRIINIRESILGNIPKWLRYNADDMGKDITDVVVFCYKDIGLLLESED
jgi:hypothetical protein